MQTHESPAIIIGTWLQIQACSSGAAGHENHANMGLLMCGITGGCCRRSIPCGLAHGRSGADVQEPAVVAALETVQAAVVAHDGRLRRACVASCTAHITLGVLHLDSGEPSGLCECNRMRQLSVFSHWGHGRLSRGVQHDIALQR